MITYCMATKADLARRDALRAADSWLTRWGFEQREVA